MSTILKYWQNTCLIIDDFSLILCLWILNFIFWILQRFWCTLWLYIKYKISFTVFIFIMRYASLSFIFLSSNKFTMKDFSVLLLLLKELIVNLLIFNCEIILSTSFWRSRQYPIAFPIFYKWNKINTICQMNKKYVALI